MYQIIVEWNHYTSTIITFSLFVLVLSVCTWWYFLLQFQLWSFFQQNENHEFTRVKRPYTWTVFQVRSYQWLVSQTFWFNNFIFLVSSQKPYDLIRFCGDVFDMCVLIHLFWDCYFAVVTTFKFKNVLVKEKFLR